ncbi:MAG: aminopeptidase, partial [Cyanobacteria bacterium REEB65]|nr:aminopeptidase [Cyanobacteria bacterium REEB65]
MPRRTPLPPILRGLGILAMAFCLHGCWAGYVLRQGAAQVDLLLRQEPLDEALPKLPPHQAELARIARQAKRFAITEIGLKDSGSYETFVQLKRGALTYVVSAAYRDRLEPYLWHFPLVGAVPYKGFFDKSEAEAERDRLERRGLDTYLRGVEAFSLLGIVRDPLYSTMLHGTAG